MSFFFKMITGVEERKKKKYVYLLLFLKFGFKISTTIGGCSLDVTTEEAIEDATEEAIEEVTEEDAILEEAA